MDNHPTNENKAGATGEEDSGSYGENDQLIHRAQSIAMTTYNQEMDVIFSSHSSPTNPYSPFTYVQIKTCHDALVENIMEALEQTNASVFNQIRMHLSKVFSTQLAIYQNRNELIVEKWAERVTQATREAENWYEAELVKQWGDKLLQIKKTEELSSKFKDLHERVESDAILQFSQALSLPPSDKSASPTQSPLLKQIRFLLNEKKEELQENLMLQLQQNIATRRPTISKKPEINVEGIVEVNTPSTSQNLNENGVYPSSNIRSQDDAGSSQQAALPEPQSKLPSGTQIKRSAPVQSPRHNTPTVPKEAKANEPNLQEIPNQKDKIQNPVDLSAKTGSEKIAQKPLTQSIVPKESSQSESDRPSQEVGSSQEIVSNHPDRTNPQMSEGTRTPNIPGTPFQQHKIPSSSNVSVSEKNSSNHQTNYSVTVPSEGKIALQDSQIQLEKRQNQEDPSVTEIGPTPTTRRTAADQNSQSALPSVNQSQHLNNRKTRSSSIQPPSQLPSDNVSNPKPKEAYPGNSSQKVTYINQKALKKDQQCSHQKIPNAPDSQNISVPHHPSKLLLLITRSKIYLKLINQNQNSNSILQENKVEEIPPYVQMDEERILVGKEAKDADIPNVTFNFNVLRLLFGKSRTVPLGPKRTLSVEEIIAGFFRELKESIVRKSGGKIDGHAIIYPAYLTNFQLRTLTIAAKLGGCTPLRTMSFHLAHAVALASQMSATREKIKKLEKILLIHMTQTQRSFDAVVTNLSFDSSGQASAVSVGSYASLEDLSNQDYFKCLHLELIRQVQKGEVSENTRGSTLDMYKQILTASFNATVHKDVYFIFEENLESMAPILQEEIFKNKNLINVRESDVLREAELLVQCIFAEKSTSNHPDLHVSDVYSRSFGFWKPKIAFADPSSPKQKSAFNNFKKLVKLPVIVKGLLNKPTESMEEKDLIEMLVKNQSVPSGITLHEAAYDVTGSNRIFEFILGSKLEQEVYSFEYVRNHVAPSKLSVQVRLPSDDGLYTLHLTDQTGCPVELKNHTFPHLDRLIRECTEAETVGSTIL